MSRARPDFELDAPPTSALEQLLEQLEPEEIEELGLSQQLRPVPSVPAFKPGLNNRLGAKYTRQSLTLFLLNPHAVGPEGKCRHYDCHLRRPQILPPI